MKTPPAHAPSTIPDELVTWYDLAACRGADTAIFFYEPHEHNKKKAAKRLCAVCPVRVECENTAIADSEPGHWSVSAADRRKVRRNRQGGKTLKPYTTLALILFELAAAGVMTDANFAATLNVQQGTACARRTEGVQRGLIEWAGEIALTHVGRKSNLWRLTDAGRAYVEVNR